MADLRAGIHKNDRRAWVVLSAPGAEAAELGGSHLDLRTEAELRSNPQLRSLGSDVLADDFDAAAGVQALRAADQSREIGEILLDQRVLAGIGNIYKCEGCWSARIDPWQALSDLEDEDLRRVVIEIGGLDAVRRRGRADAAFDLPPHRAALSPLRHPDLVGRPGRCEPDDLLVRVLSASRQAEARHNRRVREEG